MTRHMFKVLIVIALGALYVAAVIIFAPRQSDLGPRSPVEVQEPLPHRVVQEYQVE